MGAERAAGTSRLWRGRLGKSLAFLVAVGVVPATALAQSGSPDASAADPPGLGHSDTGLWIVQLDEPSLATYSGGVDGLRATSPQATGEQQVDVDTAVSQAYLAHIGERHDQFAARATRTLGRSVDLEREYRHVLNAVAVGADQAEAARLARLPGVAAVYPEKLRHLTTDVSNDVIGSPAVWNGGTGTDVGTRGEGVVVGVLDSGINPDHPSFAEVDGEGYRHQNPLESGHYLGVCDPENQSQPDESICNDKLIGAWAFDFRSFSARDADDHGSHTSATAVGNVHEATFSVGTAEFTRTVSGVAPRANLIAYRVCAADCPITAILSGVDQAIADGVDVLNYSISGSDDPWNDPVDLAFLEASSAGVFVAASAGNNGPDAGTLAHTGPWTTAVAASTTNRAFAQTLDVVNPAPPADLVGMAAVPGDGGPGVSEPVEAPIRDAGAVDESNVRGCAAFPAGAFSGAIALIERGDCAFSEKVNHAADAGATAVVVFNHAAGPATTMGGLNTTSVPAVMIDRNSGAAVRDFVGAADGDVAVRINPETQMIVNDKWADVVADFSSRGPSRHDVAAPTVSAPGVNILAAGAGAADRYAVLQGTSMASPHVAGGGALLSALYPDWTPTQIRSALASTADPDALTSDGTAPADVFDQGGGLMDLDSAGRVGLVLDETYEDFLAADPNPAVGGDPRTLNVPAMVDRNCAATCSWTRTVTNVADTTTAYAAHSSGPEGVAVTAEPATFSLEPGESRSVEFTATVQDRAAGQWTHAAVTLSTDDVHPGGAAIADVRFPIAVIPTPATFTVDPGEVVAEQEPDTQTEHTVTIGNTGGEDLTWSIAADPGDRAITLRPTTTTPITVTAPTGDEAGGDGVALDRNVRHSADDAPASPADPAAADLPDGSVSLTHSESQHIVPNNTVACSAEGLTADNGYLRTFTLEDFAIFSDFDVTEVSFGVEAVNRSPITVTVRLYTLDAEPISYANLTEIGSADVTLEPQALQMVTVPVTGTAPAGSTLVVEIDAPDSRTVSGFFAGSNGAGESAPSYLRSATCGMPEPTPMETAGFPSTHLVMNVTGVAEAPDTHLPDWIDVRPTSGTVAAGTTQDVTVALDSTGMVEGDTQESTLVLESNDPNRQYAVIPITLTVTGDGGSPGEPTGASEEIIATVPEDSGVGSLILSVDPQDRTVTLPEMTSAGDRLSTGGELRPVTVTDTRVMDPGWDVSAQVSDFTSDAATFGGGFLGWSPTVGSVSDGQQVSPGSVVAPGFPSGDGLSVPRRVASAPAGGGTGTAVLGADLRLQVPMDTPAGVYTALLTITAM